MEKGKKTPICVSLDKKTIQMLNEIYMKMLMKAEKTINKSDVFAIAISELFEKEIGSEKTKQKQRKRNDKVQKS